MKENAFSEKDSLELITLMIQQTKKKMEVGSGNVFLYYGYSVLILSVIIFLLVHFTGHRLWSFLWLLMFVPSILIQLKSAKEKPKVITYTDKAVANTWIVLGTLFGLTFLTILLLGFSIGSANFILMLPLSLLYAGIGTSITGVLTQSRILVYSPLPGFITSIYMLIELTVNNELAHPFWDLCFGISFLIMMVIPGHIINRQAYLSCSKN